MASVGKRAVDRRRATRNAKLPADVRLALAARADALEGS
jgi:hypothetical protein